jgi:outer membrane lipoprotein SlyB
MKHWLLSLTIVALAASSPVYAKGCIKGAIVGGVAGSAVGHGKMGAAAGCAVGHHEANKADNTKGAPQPSSQPAK